MRPKLLWLLITILLITGSVHAQQLTKIPRIGFLDDSTASNIAVRLDMFRQELSKLGWIEGKNVAIEYRFAEGKLERLPELAADLARLKVDVIVTRATTATLAAKRATTTIPIVMAGAWGPRERRFGGQFGAAGRQCHRFLEFSVRANHEKAGGTQGRGSKALPSWTSNGYGRQHSTRPPTERA